MADKKGKVAHWIDEGIYSNTDYHRFKCSDCGNTVIRPANVNVYKCLNCGASMEE